MASHSLGLSLHEAARRMGVLFVEENEPEDRFVDANGLRFHYLEWGDPSNPTVLMLHGVSQQAHSWDFISLPLSPDYHVIALDQRGHGDSDWAADGDYTLDAMVADLDSDCPSVWVWTAAPSTGSGQAQDSTSWDTRWVGATASCGRRGTLVRSSR